jgi:hypothetical protein
MIPTITRGRGVVRGVQRRALEALQMTDVPRCKAHVLTVRIHNFRCHLPHNRHEQVLNEVAK